MLREIFMVDYVQTNAAYLNEQGPLGTFSTAMLKKQIEFFRGMPSLGIHAKDNRMLTLTQHFHLGRQFYLLKSANLDMGFPSTFHVNTEASMLQNMLAGMKYDPLMLGEQRRIPLDIHMRLKELGITDLSKKLCQGRAKSQQVIATSELARKYGKAVKDRHKIALNRLALMLNDPLDSNRLLARIGTADLPAKQRVIHPKFAITQIYAIPSQGDWHALQACFKHSKEMATQLCSVGSRIVLNLAPPGLEDAALRPQQEAPLVKSVNRIGFEYGQYKKKFLLPPPSPQEEAEKAEDRNVRSRTAESAEGGGRPPASANEAQPAPTAQPAEGDPPAPPPPAEHLHPDENSLPNHTDLERPDTESHQVHGSASESKRETRRPKSTKQERKAAKEGLEPPPGLTSFQEYKNWVVDHCKDWQLLQTLYNDQEFIRAVHSEHQEKGQCSTHLFQSPHQGNSNPLLII